MVFVEAICRCSFKTDCNVEVEKLNALTLNENRWIENNVVKVDKLMVLMLRNICWIRYQVVDFDIYFLSWILLQFGYHTCKLRFDRPFWLIFVLWSDVCFEVLSCFFDHPSIDSTKTMPLASVWKGCFWKCFASIKLLSASRRSFQRVLLSNIPWMAPDQMAFLKNIK